MKLSFGQRVGQSREMAEVESFPAKLRRELAERECSCDRRAIKLQRERQTVHERFAAVRERAAYDLPKERRIPRPHRR